jgi:hypothetical protein
MVASRKREWTIKFHDKGEGENFLTLCTATNFSKIVFFYGMKCGGSEGFFFGRYWNSRSMKLNENIFFCEWKQYVLPNKF